MKKIMIALAFLCAVCYAISAEGKAFLDLYRDIRIEHGAPDWGYIEMSMESCLVYFFWSNGLNMILRGARWFDCWRVVSVYKNISS